MKKFLQKRIKNEKGLTLVELLAVIVILGIIAAIAVPSIGGIIENTRVKAVKADAQTAISAAQLYFTENASATDLKNPISVADLVTNGYLADKASLDDTKTSVTKAVLEAASAKQTKPATITGEGTYGSNKKVTFTGATSKGITNSGNAKSVTE